MPQLDSLRALAFLGVAASHWLTNQFPAAAVGGTGVQLFFVLSGFLITGILLDYRRTQESNSHLTASSALRTFYARRFFRIFPLFYGVIAITALLNIGPIRELWPWHVSYASNFLYATHKASAHDPFTHFWSLAVEEQFYLVWPFLIFLVHRRILRWLILALIVLAPAFRIGMEMLFPELHRVNYLPLSCGDALGVGAYLAFAARSAHPSSASIVARNMGLLGMAGGMATAGMMLLKGRTFWLESVGHTSLVLVFGWLVFGAAQGFGGPLGWALKQPMLRFLGLISYGLYVFHHFFTHLNLGNVFLWIRLPAHWSENILVQFLVRFLLTLLVAMISWYLYEKPLNNLKRHFTLRKKLADAPVPKSLELSASPTASP